ncbi:helix-turn-helix domain-containing protein [Nocardia higoensis]|uniref:helix-turn-helix domain-containing protein n=1 Tax=Nocardia higoensis TaxID=228599 RepID=UPI0002E4C50F|nr:helix-turn-helix domain-containing protein [Nocardia higoensis]
MDSVELLLHPVRMRIVQAFLGDRSLTTAALGEELGDVPAGSLYRHIARLVDGGVLTVADERRVRGTVERTYRLELAAAGIDPGDLATMTAEDHRRAFLAYIAGMMLDFDRYLARGEIDLARDGIGYSVSGLWLDDAELDALGQALAAAIVPLTNNGPAPGRKLRMLRTVMLPGPQTPDAPDA